MRKLLFISVAVLVGVLAASPASAGGWAVTTLDEVPSPVAGEDVDVGFTIRQHGKTPVDVEEAGIAIGPAGGKRAYFKARQEGPTGHYVATVRFPADGTYTWEVVQGWFGPQSLGTIDVPGGAPVPVAAPVTIRHEPVQLPLAVRLLLPTVALAAGGLALADVLHARRQRLAAA
jgi:hypothetical protein